MPPFVFVRVANEAAFTSIWRDEGIEAAGVEVELGPAEITSFGLNEKLREALDAEVEAAAKQHQGPAKKQKIGPSLESPGAPAELKRIMPVEPVLATPPGTLVGGYNQDWRWDFVRDGEDVIVVMDNRPRIDRLVADLQSPPALYQLAAPLDLLQHIVSS